MKRFVLGLLAANLASAYLAAFVILLYSPGPFTVATPLDLWKFIPFGTAIALNLWLPFLTTSAFLAGLLGAAGARESWHYALGGAVLGIGSGLAIHEGVFSGASPPLLIGLVCGTISGWIYWRVTMKPPIIKSRP